jgi:general secretion pathway protein J
MTFARRRPDAGERTPRTLRCQRGLTLLEMLIALVLMSLLLVLLFGGLRLASRSWDAGDAYGTRVEQMQLVENFLRRRISEVFPYRLQANPNRPNAVFLGYGAGSQGIQFVAPMPAAGARGGLYILRIGLAPSKHGYALMLWRTPLGTEQPDNAQESAANAPVMLADHVGSVEFAYFGRPSGTDGPPAWNAQWRDPTQVPLLVRMRLTLADGSRWPDLVVAPRISAIVAIGN